MFSVPRSTRILLSAEPVDLRKSIDGLAAIVRSGWKEDVFSGHLFVFMSRRHDRVKVLTWESGRFGLYYTRLERGRFRLPSIPEGALGVAMDGTQLAMLLDGIDTSRVRRPAKWQPPEESDRRQISNVIEPRRWPPSAKSIRASGGTKQSGCATSSPPSKRSSQGCKRSSKSSRGTSSGSARRR
jgi:transposase